MFKVYCRSKAHKQWKPYSQPFIELSNALKCKEKCESRKICDVYGNLIEYKVVEENEWVAKLTNNLLKEDNDKNTNLSEHENYNLDICDYCENKSVCDKCIYKDSKD